MKRIIHIDPQIKFRKIEDLLDEPVIAYVSTFDDAGAKDLQIDISDAHQTGQPVIPVIIDSFGGDVYALLSMMSAFDHSELPVATVVTGKAMSCGALLFCYGTEGYRFLDRNAVLMMHQIEAGSRGKVEDLKEDITHIDSLNQKLYKRVSLHLGHPENYLHDLVLKKHNADWFIPAKEAKKRKMANHLKIPSFQVHISVNTEFG